jgi:drug/metabolite transporter superfamily protein YnfA
MKRLVATFTWAVLCLGCGAYSAYLWHIKNNAFIVFLVGAVLFAIFEYKTLRGDEL